MIETNKYKLFTSTLRVWDLEEAAQLFFSLWFSSLYRQRLVLGGALLFRDDEPMMEYPNTEHNLTAWVFFFEPA